QACAQACAPNHSADRVRMQRSQWGAAAQEQRAGFDSRTSVSEVRHERLAHIDRQWQAIVTATLASDSDLARLPVNVTQLQAGHLGCPQAEAGQQCEDGEVA